MDAVSNNIAKGTNMPPDIEESSWNEYKLLVLKELERLNENILALQNELHEAKVEVAKLQTKASIWGGLAGTIPALIAIIVSIFLGFWK